MQHMQPPRNAAEKTPPVSVHMKPISVFGCLKSQGPLNQSKNNSDNSLKQDLTIDTTLTSPFFSFPNTFKQRIRQGP